VPTSIDRDVCQFRRPASIHTGGRNGELAGHSMVKTAGALAAAAGMNTQFCDAAMQYLKSDTVTPPYLFYLRDLVANRPSTHSFSCVSAVGTPSRHTPRQARGEQTCATLSHQTARAADWA